jgi:flagellin-like hook-associated protein FlgL
MNRTDILTQSGMAMMSQANVAAQSVLKLLQA